MNENRIANSKIINDMIVPIGSKTDMIPVRADNIRKPNRKYSSILNLSQTSLPFSRILTTLEAENPQTNIVRKTIIQVNKTRIIAQIRNRPYLRMQ